MLVVADVNTAWREKPFEALGRWRPVLGLAPVDPVLAWRKRRWPLRPLKTVYGPDLFQTLPVRMRFGWASARLEDSIMDLWRQTNLYCRQSDKQPSALVVTTPHYAPLVAKMRSRLPCFYYCSDDFRSYQGWSKSELTELEIELVKLAQHSFFVSEGLAQRALAETGVEPERISVSMNATEEIFLMKVPQVRIDHLLLKVSAIRRPIVGVVGVINERLDFQLLNRCVEMPEIGSMLFVGPVAKSLKNNSSWSRLKDNQKSIFVGARPRNELPAWIQALNLALIPYRDCQFNRFCSPMRLFDYLASGVPIMATKACHQVLDFRHQVSIPDTTEAWETTLRDLVEQKKTNNQRSGRNGIGQAHTWSVRAESIAKTLANYGC